MIEYYTNGGLKHRIVYYPDGNKLYEQFYDERGRDHREQGLPDYHEWYDNGITYHITYYVHDGIHNICNPSDVYFTRNGKIWGKDYDLNNYKYSKLGWQNKIKNI